MITDEQARLMFNDLRDDDQDFDTQWGYSNIKEQNKTFYEWCSIYDDLKHIKPKEIV